MSMVLGSTVFPPLERRPILSIRGKAPGFIRTSSGLRSLCSMFRIEPNFRSKVSVTSSSRRGSSSVTKAKWLSDEAISVMKTALEKALSYGYSSIQDEHILLSLVCNDNGRAFNILKSSGIIEDRVAEKMDKAGESLSRQSIPPQAAPFSNSVDSVIKISLEEARHSGQKVIAPEHLLLGLLSIEGGKVANILRSLGVKPSVIRKKVKNDKGYKQSHENYMPTVTKYGTDLTKLAKEGKMDPVIGRQDQIAQVVQILCKRSKNNPCLVGQPGVGKTAIVEGLAQLIVSAKVPASIMGKKVISMNVGDLVAGTMYRGDFEERLGLLIDEVMKSDNIILFIDEVHTLLGAGNSIGSTDAANILKPALARGGFQCIGATTYDEYQQYIEQDKALERRFQTVKVPEPTIDETIKILQGLRRSFENHHHLCYTDDALVSAAKLSSRYISDRYLPDKAIDVFDEAGSRVRCREFEKTMEFEQTMEFEKTMEEILADIRVEVWKPERDATEAGDVEEDARLVVTEDDVESVISSWTSIPLEKLSADESDSLLKMEETLHKRVIGQIEAVSAISRAFQRARCGINNPHRPLASFIFAGPTGVGKTELVKALAEDYFGSEEAMVRLDMSEYMEKHDVSKMIGAPPGYLGYNNGGQLTEAVRRRPHTVVLFDEIEKAHPQVFNLMLQILDDGRLTDSKGRTVNFKNSLIVMTSNIGSCVIQSGGKKVGFLHQEYDKKDEEDNDYKRIESLVIEELQHYFRPEFLNRLDGIIVFRALNKSEVKDILELMLREEFERFKNREISVEVTEKFKERVVDEGYSPTYGARSLRRAVIRLLEDTLVEKMLSRQIKEGDMILLDVDDGGHVKVLNQ